VPDVAPGGERAPDPPPRPPVPPARKASDPPAGPSGAESARPSGASDRPSASEQISRAREALAAARAAARADGRSLAASPAPVRPAGSPGRPDLTAGRPESADETDSAGTPAGLAGLGGPAAAPAVPAKRAEPPRAARRVRRDDPQALGTAIGGLLDTEGWSQAAATGSVFGRWAQIVGADLAGHTKPETLRDGELTVIADSTAWATQVRLLSAQLVHRLNLELGHGTVLRVKVRGPVTADRRPGEWRVRGSRGPRDTYG
jgi:predicted nucleic acid-binding Zn ribbon protein